QRRVAGHGAGVAEAEIDVAMSVHVEKLGAVSLAHERRKSAGPFGHPVHGDSAQQRFAGALEQGLDLGRSSMNFFCSDCIKDCRRSRLIAGIHLPKLSRSLHFEELAIVVEQNLAVKRRLLYASSAREN